MKILVNALSVKEGGPLVLLSRLSREMRRLGGDALALETIGTSRLLDANLQADFGKLHLCDWATSSPAHLAYWYDVAFPSLVRRQRPDVVFSQTNYLPRFGLAVPSLLLVQHAGFFSPIFEALERRAHPGLVNRVAWNSKKRRIIGSVRCATRVTVQTAALADAIAQTTGRSRGDFFVIPHGTGTVDAREPPPPREGAEFRIGCLTKPGVQKNLAPLLKATAILRRENRPVRLVLTLGRDPAFREPLDALIGELGLGDAIEDHQERAFGEMVALYDSLDAFVFPSVCESFGFPMVEAMARGAPLIIADTVSNREVAGAAGLPVRADAPEDYADALRAWMDAPAQREAAATRSIARAADFGWAKAAAATLAALRALAMQREAA